MQTQHPLTTLQSHEIVTAIDICVNQALKPRNIALQYLLFANVELLEPSKEQVWKWEATTNARHNTSNIIEIDRRAKVHIVCNATPCTLNTGWHTIKTVNFFIFFLKINR